jgi:hypothetical protein
MSELAGDRPFAIWRVFYDAPRWWFAKGCPPTVRSLAGWPRALHASVLLCAMGLAAMLVATPLVWFVNSGDVEPQWFFGAIGTSFGVFTLLPLSRWVGRPWWLACLSVVWSTAWFGMLYWIWTFWETALSFSVDWPEPWNTAPTWIVSTTTLCVGVSVWMIAPSRRGTWVIPAVSALGSLVSMVPIVALIWIDSVSPGATMPYEFVTFLLGVQPLVMLLTCTAVALSMRLWRDESPELPETATEVTL